MLFRIDLPIGLGDPTFGIDHVGNALRVLSRRLVAGAVGYSDRSVGVTQQLEREVELLCKVAILFDGVKAHAEYFGILGGVFLDSITESFSLSRSARCVGLWIKPHYDGLAPLPCQADIFSRVGADGELGRHLSNF